MNKPSSPDFPGDAVCPCGSSLKYNACCEPYLSGQCDVPTAEALMRSRYTAYVLGACDYIVDTIDPESQSRYDRKAMEKWSRESEWQGLEILDAKDGQPGDREGDVEFIVRYREKQVMQTLHERSKFVWKNNRWYYVDGETVRSKPLVRQSPRTGRNEPCPCGSGKKFKRCCGR